MKRGEQVDEAAVPLRNGGVEDRAEQQRWAEGDDRGDHDRRPGTARSIGGRGGRSTRPAGKSLGSAGRRRPGRCRAAASSEDPSACFEATGAVAPNLRPNTIGSVFTPLTIVDGRARRSARRQRGPRRAALAGGLLALAVVSCGTSAGVTAADSEPLDGAGHPDRGPDGRPDRRLADRLDVVRRRARLRPVGRAARLRGSRQSDHHVEPRPASGDGP